MLYLKFSGHINRNLLITVSYLVATISGVLIFTIGRTSSWMFALSLLPATIAGSITRPPTANLMLEQVHEDIGAASSLMSFTFTVLGSIGMALISNNLINRVHMLGLMYMIIAPVSLVLWLIISQKPYIKQVSDF